ncbi:CHC2 zinc finger domain-containing protein [Verrucomicrobiota bacterium]
MSSGTADNIREYYRQITEVDIGDIARELIAGRITQETKQSILCDCPHHQSQSRRSLHIMLDKQGWYCFGCGVGGDVLQLAEFILSGAVTAGQSGPMPESHKNARDFLAGKAGLPPLSGYGLSPERLEQLEKERAHELRVKDALSALAAFYHQQLKSNPDAMEWLKSKYAISDETIDALQIGFADNTGVMAHLLSGDQKFTKRELAATGAFRTTSQDGLVPFFEKRMIFPYWSRGRVVFMIGRKTPKTPDNKWEQGKYKKLPVYDEHQRPNIAPFINNAVLFNEDALLSKPERIIITEGVTDCIALMQQGFPVISPVTVRIRGEDWKRLIPKMRDIKTVYICQDNEISEAGLNGALITARTLAKHQIETKVATIPLNEQQLLARGALRDRYNLTTAVGPKELIKLLAGRSDDEVHEAKALMAQAKIDANDYFASGKEAADFEALLTSACTPVELGIQNLPDDMSESERDRLLEPILAEVAAHSPLKQDRLLKQIHARINKTVPLAALKEEIRQVSRNRKKSETEAEKRAKRLSGVTPGSCKARIQEALFDSELATGSADYTQAAEAAFEWFTEHSGQFFYTLAKEPFMYYDNSIYWMDSSDRGRKRHFASMVYKMSGLVPTNNGGRIFFDVLPTLALIKGERRDHFSWLHSDIPKHAVFFNLNNEAQEIVKITPDGIEVMKNGGNADGVILDGSQKMKPIQFMPDADVEEADRLLIDLIFHNLTCSPDDRYLIMSWISCFLLIDFSGTKPMTRFEGSAGSGKTTASKLITTMLYGEPQHKKATDAANYTDGTKNPLIALDNIEVKQMTEELTTFMLTSITGIAKEKRKGGTDSETVSERTKCLLNTTGIEPLCGELSEIQSRSFVINFERQNQTNACFIESEIIAAIQKNRDLILSALMKRTSEVLAMIRDGKRSKTMELLLGALGDHDKRRCNEYLSLMYLITLSSDSEAEREQALKEIQPEFVQQIKSLNEATQATARDSNHIATALNALFQAYSNAVDLDEKATYSGERSNHLSSFIERYQIQLSCRNRISDISSSKLLIALRRISKDFSLEFDFKTPAQLGKRVANDLEIIESAGIKIERVRNKKQKSWQYSIERI